MVSRYAPFALVTSVIGLALYFSATPSPLYEEYQDLWGFSSIVLTVVFALYAFGVLVSLLLAGRVSDHIGRRPVLLVALGALIGTTVLFMLADSVAWLLVARLIQGLATGLALGAAGAAMLDLHPRQDGAAVGFANGVVSAAGLALGVLITELIVELLPAPRVTPYALLFVLFAVAFAGTVALREPVTDRRSLRLTPQRPHVPAAVRRPFFLAALAVFSSWSLAGLSLALGPQLADDVFGGHVHLAGGAICFAFFAAGTVGQLATRHVAPWRCATGGAIALAIGVSMIVLAAAASSGPFFVAGMTLGGAGWGIAFLGGLRTLTAVIPAHHRAEVMSAFYVVAYLSLSVPAILAGVLVSTLGLAATYEIFGAVVAVLALGVALEAWRGRTRVPAVAGPVLP